jgi:hypothetical protein
MARACAGCGYYATGDETGCPTCGRALQFTLLPPRGTPDTPAIKLPPQLSGGPTQGPLYNGQGSLDLLQWFSQNRMLAGIFVAPLVLLAMFVFGNSRGSAREKFDAIRVGMTVDQVDSILRQSGGSGMRTLSRRFTEDGGGEMTWSAGSMSITVRFRDGRVVSKSQSGLDDES